MRRQRDVEIALPRRLVHVAGNETVEYAAVLRLLDALRQDKTSTNILDVLWPDTSVAVRELECAVRDDGRRRGIMSPGNQNAGQLLQGTNVDRGDRRRGVVDVVKQVRILRIVVA